jgi:hypothetical protein
VFEITGFRAGNGLINSAGSRRDYTCAREHITKPESIALGEAFGGDVGRYLRAVRCGRDGAGVGGEVWDFAGLTKAKASDGIARALAEQAEEEEAREAAHIAEYVERVALMSTSALTLHLERVSLNLLAEMLSKQRIADARALVVVMEALSRRALMENAHAAAAAQRESFDQRAAKEKEAVDRFGVAMHIAYHMLHDPENAPGIFADLIADWRRAQLGEGDEAAVAQARRQAAQARRYFGFPGTAWPKTLAEITSSPLISREPAVESEDAR